MAALLMHEALVMDVEAGVPPMAAIHAATLNVAKTFGKDKDYGSVERGDGGMWPFHRVLLNGRALPTSFVSKNELKATIPPEAIAKAGTYIVTLQCEGEPFPQSNRAHLVVGFKE